MLRIAIDGPAGSGKSTIAKLLSERLNITYIDTGAMYRALGYKVLKCKIESESDIEKLLVSTNIDYKDSKIYLDGEDVSTLIRSEEISKQASKISKLKSVREYLVDIQKKIASKTSVVMEGRDITTVVLPDAEFKFFLTASVDTRAKRRYEQLIEKGEDVKFADVKSDIEKRDYNDSHRENSPLRQAEDAILVDSSNMDLEETLTFMLDKIRG